MNCDELYFKTLHFQTCMLILFKQLLEVPYDSQMNRTKHRVLVKGFLR